jgi:hypothetical protein
VPGVGVKVVRSSISMRARSNASGGMSRSRTRANWSSELSMPSIVSSGKNGTPSKESRLSGSMTQPPRLGNGELDGEAAGPRLLDEEDALVELAAIERDRQHPLDPAPFVQERQVEGVPAKGDPGFGLRLLQLLDELELDHPGRTGGGHQRRLPRQACRGG